jgi:cation diffusion facilitator family transporter
MVYESIERLINPVEIAFGQAIAVAVVGLVVNGISMLILKEGHHHDHDGHTHHDHNLMSAYLHVLADALTSILAIGALLAARYLGWVWFDPVMGLVGAALVARWSWGLIRSTGRVLLDFTADDQLIDDVRHAIEQEGARILDLHVWAIGPAMHCVVASIETRSATPAQQYRDKVLAIAHVVHASIEINSEGAT